MTPEQHIEVGRILGFPECCIDEWVDAPQDAGKLRGAVTERVRTPEEARDIDDAVSRFLGRPWCGATGDPRKRWIPCLQPGCPASDMPVDMYAVGR